MNWNAFITCAITGAATRWASTPRSRSPRPRSRTPRSRPPGPARRSSTSTCDPETGRGGATRPSFARRWSGSAGPGPTWSLTSPPGWGGPHPRAGRDSAPPGSGGDRHGRAARAAGPRRGASPRDLHPRLRHDELRRGRLRHDQHPVDAPRDGEAGQEARRAAGARGLRYRHLVFAKRMVDEGLIESPLLVQLCMGIPYGAPDDPGTLLAMVNQLPPGTHWSTFSIGRMQLPYVAMAVLAGGNVRVGLEDNLYLERGCTRRTRTSSRGRGRSFAR